MSYVALARRYRPQTFADVIGQSHVTETLRQAIGAGRVAPAYLFTGPRGSGKTTIARIVAKAVNCDKPKDGEPCGKCESCTTITEGRSLDVIEIDGASNNSVDDVRQLREDVGYAASRPGKRKVYIVDEVHMLSLGAFNALLKTLEEPPPHVMFAFATTEPRKVPATIASRCQRFDFRRLQTDEIRARLVYICKKEKLDVEDAAIFVIAKRADGSMRDGLSLLDQVISSCSGTIRVAQVAEVLGLVPVEAYFDLTRAVLDRDAKKALDLLHGVLRSGADASDYVLGLVEHLRNLMLLAIDPALASAVQLGDAHLKDAQVLASRFKIEDLLYLLDRAANLFEDVRRSPQPVVGLEAAIVEMTRFESRVVLADLLQQLDGGPAPAPSAPGSGGASGPSRSSTAKSTPPPSPASGRRTGSTRAQDEGAIVAQAGAIAPIIPFSAPSASLDVETVSARWHQFTTELRSTQAFLAVCLAEAKPVRLAAGTVEVAISAEHAFQLHAVQDAIRTHEIDPYLKTFFGASLKLALANPDGSGSVFAAGAGSASPPPLQLGTVTPRLTPDDIARSRRGSIEDVVQATPEIEDIIQAFDGEVLEDGD